MFLLVVSMYAESAESTESTESTEFVVVVNKNNTINALSKREVIDIYMGRYSTFPDGEISKPLDLPAKSAFKNDFAYWARLLFSGRGKPPTPSASLEDALKTIASSQYAIGYIPLSHVTDTVKVVYTFD